MGTRSLTIIVKNKQNKMAKYAQFDGYPQALGNQLIKTIQQIGIQRLHEIAELITPIQKEEIDYVNSFDEIVKVPSKYGLSKPDEIVEWALKWPCLTREYNGADVMLHVNETNEKTWLLFDDNFAADSLFCEWCYV